MIKISRASYAQNILKMLCFFGVLVFHNSYGAPGSVIYSYDNQGRLKTISYPNGAVINYTLDTEGNRLTESFSHVLVDSDSDGIADAYDNCPSMSNQNQSNHDGDLQGDVCDADDDGDLIADVNDAFPLNGNEWLDEDGDGMPASWEIAYGLNPLVADGNGDIDGDGLSNLEEYQLGYDPTVEFQAIANSVVMREGFSALILGKDLLANDFNPLSLNLLISSVTNHNAAGAPTMVAGDVQFIANMVSQESNGVMEYVASGNGKISAVGVVVTVHDTSEVLMGSPDDDIVFSAGNSTVNAKGGDDIIYDTTGDDSFIQGNSDGSDRLTINSSIVNRSDSLTFSNSIPEDINLYKDGDDLVFNVRNSPSDVTVVNALLSEKNHNLTNIIFSDTSSWDLSKVIAVNDYVDIVSYGGVMALMPDAIELLMLNDFVPRGIRAGFELIQGSESGGTVQVSWFYVGQYIEFTLSGGSTGSFQYKIYNLDNPSDYSIATVFLSAVAQDVTGITMNGDGDDNIISGTVGNDTFSGGAGFDIIDGIGGEDIVLFGMGDDKDSYRVLFDDGGFITGDGPGDFGDTVNIDTLARNKVELRREGLDLVAKIRKTGESIRILDHMLHPATINNSLGQPNGLLPLKKLVFDDSEVSAGGFTASADSVLIIAATENATKTCSVGGVSGSICIGTNGNDKVNGGSGFDMLGGTDNDVMFGMSGDDQLTASAGNDYLYGGLGSDILAGDSEDDHLFGDQGDDWLNPGSGFDYMNGGAGADFYVLDYSYGTNIIDNFDLTTGPNETSMDSLWFTSNIVSRHQVKFARAADDLIIKISNTALTSTSTTTIPSYFSLSGYNALHARFATLNTPVGAPEWDGTCIDYSLTDGSGTTPQPGDSGLFCIPVRVIYDMTHDDTCSNPVLDDDVLLGYDGVDTINANCGNDTVYGNNGNDVIHGNAGNDYIDGGWGHDSLFGDEGNDVLIGGWGADTLYGGDGDDTLYASNFQATSNMHGNKGNDYYIVSDVEYQHEVHAVVSSDTGGDQITFSNPESAPESYWIYETNYGGASGSGNEDLAIAYIGGGVVYVIDWKVGDNQLNVIEIDNGSDTCTAFSITSISNMQAYISAIATVAGGDEPTIAEMQAVIGDPANYWIDACVP